jgi:hypothetical protein
VGERLSAPLRISARPVGRRAGGHSPACAIVASVTGCLRTTPTIRVAREGRVDEAIRCRQLRPNSIRRTAEPDALLSVEDADSPRTFSDLVEPSPIRVDL